MIKNFLVKFSLLLIILAGTASGLLLYSQILSLFGRVFDIKYAWIYIPILFSVSLFIARSGGRTLTNDLVATRTFSEIDLVMVLKFFIGGFIGCYVAFAIVGTILLSLYLIFRNLV